MACVRVVTFINFRATVNFAPDRRFPRPPRLDERPLNIRLRASCEPPAAAPPSGSESDDGALLSP